MKGGMPGRYPWTYKKPRRTKKRVVLRATRTAGRRPSRYLDFFHSSSRSLLFPITFTPPSSTAACHSSSPEHIISIFTKPSVSHMPGAISPICSQDGDFSPKARKPTGAKYKFLPAWINGMPAHWHLSPVRSQS